MKFNTRDKGSKPKAEGTTDSSMNGPITVSRIEDYPPEVRESWYNIKPARNSDGKTIRRPIVTDFMTGRNVK